MDAIGRSTLLFDLDGTLIDPRVGIIGGFRHACSQLGLETVSEANANALIGPPLQDIFANRWNLDPEGVERAVLAYREYFGTRGVGEFTPYDGISDLLHSLAKAGHELLLATSKPDVFAASILERAGWSALFDFVAGASLDGTRRHKADVIRHALLHSRSPLSAVMIGDRAEDVGGAKSAGIAAIGVTWGFGTADELLNGGADLVIDRVEELTEAAISQVVSKARTPGTQEGV